MYIFRSFLHKDKNDLKLPFIPVVHIMASESKAQN